MLPRTALVSTLALAAALAPGVRAGGHLWIGAEYAQEGHLYRYDIAAGTIDVDCVVTQPSQHWNNIAVDDSRVYLGTPTSNYFGILDATPAGPASCTLLSATTYSSPLAGHNEDGAYHAGTGRLWRVTYSGGLLHETETDGTLVSSYAINGIGTGLVGLAWAGERLYATDWSGTRFGELLFGQTEVTWVQIPWNGTAPPGNYGALAYDREDDVLYMIAASRQLYTVAVDEVAGTAEATFVVALDNVGYPGGALADGMGWIASPCEDLPVEITMPPMSTALPPGGVLSLSVAATGTAPLGYQWRRGGVPLADGGNVLGAATPTLNVDPVGAGDAGIYDCVVTNVCGQQLSGSALVTVGGGSNAAGYLWLGAEYSGEGKYYRYDVAANVVDRVCSRALPPGGEHWNNMATDGTYLYLGAPNHPILGRVSGTNCDSVTDLGYAPVLPGRLEDGAYRASSHTLWRVTYSGELYETTVDGAEVESYSIDNGLVGLAWAGDVLYATSFSTGTVGEVSLSPPTATYTPVPWDGAGPSGTLGALAWDVDGANLYLITREGLLYRVTFAAGLATSTLVEDLNAVGYPAGALPDGMGWIGSCSTAAPTVRFEADKRSLTWIPVPDATYDVVSGAFSADLTSNVWSGTGGLLQTSRCRANDSATASFDTAGLDEPGPGQVSMWLVRSCAGTWNSSGAVDRDVEILCP